MNVWVKFVVKGCEKIVRILLNAPPRFHVGASEFNTVCLLPFNYGVEQLKLDHMFNTKNVKATEYLRTNVEIVHHIYPTATWHVLFQERRVLDKRSSFIQAYAIYMSK